MILRLSQKLNSKIKAGRVKGAPLDENPYADWSCHIFSVSRTQYIIMSNTLSLYSCVMYGKGIANDGVFIKCVLEAIRDMLNDDGHQFAYRKFIAPASGIIQFSTALNRSVTGSMNDLINHAKFRLEGDQISPSEVGFELNKILLSILGDKEAKRDYGTPEVAFKNLVVD